MKIGNLQVYNKSVKGQDNKQILTQNKEKDKFAVELSKVISSKGKSNTKTNISNTSVGFAYVDKYGFSHVVKSYDTAKEFAKHNSDVYTYHGEFSGGYAQDIHGNRMSLPLPGSIPYGNETREKASDTSVTNRVDFEQTLTGYLATPIKLISDINKYAFIPEVKEE